MARFVPRERKHRKLARTKSPFSNTKTDTNTEELPLQSRTDREARREAIREQLRAAQPESKASSKKRKRLDKYIDTKLKKDENAELLKKLEAQRVDTSLLRSSKKLGRVTESKRERLHRALREKDAGLDVNGHSDGILLGERAEAKSSSNDEEPAQGEADLRDEVAPMSEVSKSTTPVAAPALFGSGLKRPLDLGEDGKPLIRKRKRRKKAKIDFVPSEDDASDITEEYTENGIIDGTDQEEVAWEGFSSEEENEEAEQDLTARESSDGDDEKLEDYSDSADSENSSAASDEDKPARVSAFKAWADTQRNKALDFTPSTAATNDTTMQTAKANFKPRVPSPDPMLDQVVTASQPTTKPAVAVAISRTKAVQQARLELPVVREEQRIMETINSHPVSVVCGATGSGKTTQVPQMLLENGYGTLGMIGVTQPRRVAATSVAARVSHELGSEYGKKVAHHVRYDTSVRKDTAIKFMTDGILLREIQKDFILSKYSVIVLDEAHERSVNTDLLIGMLSRIVPLRADLVKEKPEKHRPLKLVIMSATLSHGVDSFLQNGKLWNRISGPPPVVEAEGRQFPVTVHFARRTRRDFLSEVVEKVARGHRKLPSGGMLVFLTGQQEIATVSKQLRERIGGKGGFVAGPSNSGDADDYEDGVGTRSKDDFLEGEEDPGSDSEAEIKLNEDENEFAIEDAALPFGGGTSMKGPLKPHILPLYAALPAAQQLKVFQPSSEGHRAIILATNVAETSLTIPGVRYVFDAGRVKEKRYDTSTGVQTFEVGWISKASAEQRKGRAGRTGPGHVWRLYSSAVYEEFFAEETVPEILRTPLESTVLLLKSMDIQSVLTFPFPTQPERHQLEIAERLLVNLGALAGKPGSVTDVGKEIIKLPVSPRFGKMLMLAQRNDAVAWAAAIVAALAVGDLFIPEAQANFHGFDKSVDGQESDEDVRAQLKAEAAGRDASEQLHQRYTRAQAKLARWDDRSDVQKTLMAVALHAEAQDAGPRGTGVDSLCQQFFLREKSMAEAQMLRRQLHDLIGGLDQYATTLSLPTEKQRTILNQIAASGFIDQVAIRTDTLKGSTGFGRNPSRAIEVAYRTLFPSADASTEDKNATPEEQELHRGVFVHPSSVLAKLSVKEMPQFIVYSHLSRATPSDISSTKTKRTRMHPLTSIGPKALAVLAEGTPLLQFGKPIGKIEDLPRGGDGKQRRRCWVGLGLRAPGDASAAEWPLGAWKVVQKRGTRDWEIEEVIAR
ncbi:putative ATP-dependent RNA helicase DHR1 [Saxophila tyrrhenica]|uniref:RNA helicase n=1 Tax=Saxophila tyrrhenica TaxID=1690608 RepID=A0AAV9NV88_9PEZI|nr:putative ATP-dependent RNA helicase DHR1 [Saxophila tyrrhenica]